MAHFSDLATPTIAVAAVLIALGCQSSPAESGPTRIATASAAHSSVAQQLIIKFKPTNAERFVCDANSSARLAAATDSTLDFVRVMSGDACVVRQRANNKNELLQKQSGFCWFLVVVWLVLVVVLVVFCCLVLCVCFVFFV